MQAADQRSWSLAARISTWAGYENRRGAQATDFRAFSTVRGIVGLTSIEARRSTSNEFSQPSAPGAMGGLASGMGSARILPSSARSPGVFHVKKNWRLVMAFKEEGAPK